MSKKNNYWTPVAEELELQVTAPLAASPLETEAVLESYSEETYVW